MFFFGWLPYNQETCTLFSQDSVRLSQQLLGFLRKTHIAVKQVAKLTTKACLIICCIFKTYWWECITSKLHAHICIVNVHINRHDSLILHSLYIISSLHFQHLKVIIFKTYRLFYHRFSSFTKLEIYFLHIRTYYESSWKSTLTYAKANSYNYVCRFSKKWVSSWSQYGLKVRENITSACFMGTEEIQPAFINKVCSWNHFIKTFALLSCVIGENCGPSLLDFSFLIFYVFFTLFSFISKL